MLEITGNRNGLHINITERGVSIIVFSLFFSWLLSFPFEGQILYALASDLQIDPHRMVFRSMAAHFSGLLLSGFFIRTIRAARRMMLASIVVCICGTCVFFFRSFALWNVDLIILSFLSGICVAAWGFFLRSATKPNERMITVADGLIYSNILMIIMNIVSMNLSPYLGLGLSVMMLCGALFSALFLSVDVKNTSALREEKKEKLVNYVKPLAFLCVFVLIITVNSGLMYQVLNPAFEHLQWLVSWYWAIPYVVSLYVMKKLPRKVNRTYILYVAIAMIGFAYIAFMVLDRSAGSYLLIDTLMLGACGVYDLFWWSILGEMLDLYKNPAKILGIGLSANVLGVLLGGLIGSVILDSESTGVSPSLLALGVVCIALMILPPLHQYLSVVLKNHAFLTALSEMGLEEQSIEITVLLHLLTEREREIAELLCKGMTYRMIAGELSLSENTVKTHIKNIYSKLNIQSRVELINLFMQSKQHLP